MTDRFDDMVLLITGAASGIGLAIAEKAAVGGVQRMLLTDVDAPSLIKAVSQLPAHVQIETIVADLAEPEAANEVVNASLAAFGRVDGLVNSAGITTRANMLDGTVEIWEQIFAVNSRAPYLLMQGVIMNMRARKAAGSIVNIQSVNAHCGIAYLAIYSASKGALQTLTKNAANAHMREGIRVNGINLGWAQTQAEHHMQAKILGLGEDWAEGAAADTPLGRLLQPEEAASLAIYLLDPASAPLSGASIDLNQEVVGAPF